MQEILEASADNATSSWYGFESQGRIGLLYFLKQLNSIDIEEWDKFILEYEYMEDFAIGCIDEDGKITYKDIYQVKARESIPNEDIEKVYGELGFKQSILGVGTNVYLISKCQINESVEIESVIKEYIQRNIDEAELLFSYNDIEKIKYNLKIKNKNSELKTIRKIVRKRYKELKEITESNIKIYCEGLIAEYKRYMDNIENLSINVIIEEFNSINSSISENIKLIIKKIEPDRIDKQEEDYISKVRNALVYFLSTSLEDYILEKDQIVFRIKCKDILNIIRQDQSKISELQYLYLNAQKLENEFAIYCNDECEKGDNCEQCNIKEIIRNMRSLSVDKFRSLIINSNPQIDVEEIDYDKASSMLESGKLQEFVFDEIKANKYNFENIDTQTYLKTVNDRFMFSFINTNKKDSLLKKLDRNSINNRHIYNDNDVILNCNINLQYTIGQTLSINQHWDEDKYEENKKIMSSSIELKSFDSIRRQ